jgi:phosphatidylserine/phosphatidylglycerophosphate/cardiolipin synthase-like enzyme
MKGPTELKTAGNKRREKPFFSLLLALCIFHCPFASSSSWAGIVVQACFSPKGNCSNHIIRELQRAEKEILVAVYAFTSREIAWALVQAKQRGINVRVLLDQKFDRESKYSKGSFLKKHGLKVRRASGLSRRDKKSKGNKRRGLMHQKFAIIDSRIVLTGSYNWTASAEKFNHENLLLFRDAGPLAEEYRQQFLRLWEKGR